MSKKQSTHFLLLSEARTVSIPEVMTMAEKDVRVLFQRLRWPETDGEPVCPKCECEGAYTLSRGHRFRCPSCAHTYSVTSGTLFASHKLPLRTLLLALLLFVNATKGMSSLQLARDLGVNPKTAFVLAHKLRHALAEQRDESTMTGEVEVDGAYTGTYIRPANRKEDRVDRRSAVSPNKKCVIVLRERGGVGRTLTRVAKSETSATVIDFVTSHVAGTAKVFSDENAAYDGLVAHYDHDVVNHSREYMTRSGVNTNFVESYNARLRRFEQGQVHHLSGRYLDEYAIEIAYREDTRRMDNGAIMMDVLGKALHTSAPDQFKAYWRGKRKTVALVA